jgi:hypothetical protein
MTGEQLETGPKRVGIIGTNFHSWDVRSGRLLLRGRIVSDGGRDQQYADSIVNGYRM